MSCDKNKVFRVDNLLNELQTENQKRIARLNLGIADSDSLNWGNIRGNIHDQADLVAFTETVKSLASQTGTVMIFRLNDKTIDRTLQDIPEGWSLSIPETTVQDKLYVSQATKQGGIYQVNSLGVVWSNPIQINYSNTTDSSQQEQIDELTDRLNNAIQSQTYLDNLVQTMNQVTVNDDGTISVTGRDGQVSVWRHQDLGDYLLLGNAYGDDESYFILSKEGLLFANNAVIYGTVYATDGYFTGELRGATGSFTGNINATSGTIGGWEIKNGVLKPKNVPTSVLTGKIEADQINFGNTLTTLQNTIQRNYTSEINTIKNSILNTIESLDTKLINKEDVINGKIADLLAQKGFLAEDIQALSDQLLAEISARQNGENTLDSKIDAKASEIYGSLEDNINAILQYYLNNLVTESELETRLSLVSGEIAAKVSKTDFNVYGAQIARKLAELSITYDHIQSIVQSELAHYSLSGYVTTTELQSKITQLANLINLKVSSSTYDQDKNLLDQRLTEINQTAEQIGLSVIANGNLLSSLGISSKGIQMVGNTLSYSSPTDPQHPVLLCKADGSGHLAKGNIAWDQGGRVTLGEGVTISWSNVTGKPAEIEDVDIVNYYDTVEYYYLSETAAKADLPPYNNETSVKSYWSDTCDVLTPNKRYLWVIRLIYVKLNGEVSLNRITDPQLVYVKEAPGNYITDVKYKYYANTGANVPSTVEGYNSISDTGFGASKPYLWNKVIFLDQDNEQVNDAEWQLLSYWSTDGDTFEISSVVNYYATNDTGVVPLTSDPEWSTDYPALRQGYFLYTKVETTYTNGATTYYITTSYIGKDGQNGQDGQDGLNGANGVDGVDGTSTYFHVAYANKNTSGTIVDFSLSDPTNREYIGTYVDSTLTDSTRPSDYTWVLVKGAQGENGEQGIPGTNGADGKTSYLHIKYSNDAGQTFTSNNGETPGYYLGQYVDYEQNDSNDISKYKWALIKGQDGKDGTGISILGALNTYNELLQVDTTNLNAGDAYMVDKDLYIWTGSAWKNVGQIKGDDGRDGTDGVDGIDGTNGVSAYVHIAWANSADGSVDFATSQVAGVSYEYMGIMCDSNPIDSEDYTLYIWSKIKGDSSKLVTDMTTIYMRSSITTSPSAPTSHSSILNTNKPGDRQWTYQLPEKSSTLKYIFTCVEIENNDGSYIYSTPSRAGGLELSYTMSDAALSAREQLDELFRSPDDQSTQITSSYIYTGSFATNYAYVLSIQSSTGNNPSWQLLSNGSGYFSNGKISFDAAGNTQIGKWEINDNYIQASVTDEGAINLLGSHPQIAMSNGNDKGIVINPILGLIGGFDHPDVEAYRNTLPQGTAFRLAMDGSGFLAKNNLYWDTTGNLTINGTINATSGEIAGWSINQNYLEAIYEDDFIRLNKNAMIEMGKVNENVSLRITPSSLLIASSEDGIDYPHTCFNSDGSGFVANENITWDTNGNVVLSNNVTFGEGNTYLRWSDTVTGKLEISTDLFNIGDLMQFNTTTSSNGLIGDTGLNLSTPIRFHGVLVSEYGQAYDLASQGTIGFAAYVTGDSSHASWLSDNMSTLYMRSKEDLLIDAAESIQIGSGATLQYGAGLSTGNLTLIAQNIEFSSENTITSNQQIAVQSDMRLKTVISPIVTSLDDIADAPIFKFTWQDDDKLYIGTSAQYWNQIYQELITTNKNGYFALDYSTLGVANSITLAREVRELKAKVEELQNTINQLMK